MFNEKSPLHPPGQGPQPYVFTSPQRMYKKKVKQLQCYLCGIVMALFSLALLCAILFSVDEQEIIANDGNDTNPTPVLYSAQPGGPLNTFTLGKSSGSKDLIKKLYTSATVTGGKVTAQLDSESPVDVFTGALPVTIYLDNIVDPNAWGSSSQIKWSGVVNGNSISGTYSLPARIGNETKTWTGNFSLDLEFKWSGSLSMVESKKLYDCKVLFINYKKTVDPKDVLKGKTAVDEETCSLLLSGSFYEPSFFCYLTPWWCTKEQLFYWDGGIELKVTQPLPQPVNSTVALRVDDSGSQTKVMGSVTWGTVDVVDSVTGESVQVWSGLYPVDIDLSLFWATMSETNGSYPLTVSWSGLVSETGVKGSFKLPRMMNGMNGWIDGHFMFTVNSTELADKLNEGVTYKSPVYFHESYGPLMDKPSIPQASTSGDNVSIVLLGKRALNTFSWNGQFIVVFHETMAPKIPPSKFVLGSKTPEAKVIGSVTSGTVNIVDSITGEKNQVWTGFYPFNIDMSLLWNSKSETNGSYPLTVSWSATLYEKGVKGSFKWPRTMNGMNGWVDGDFNFVVNSTELADKFIEEVTYSSPVYFHESQGPSYKPSPQTETTSGGSISFVLLGKRVMNNTFVWNGQFIVVFGGATVSIPQSKFVLEATNPQTKILGSVTSGRLRVADSVTGVKSEVWNGTIPQDVSLSVFATAKANGSYPLKVRWSCSIFHSTLKGSFKYFNSKSEIDGDFTFQVSSNAAGVAELLIPGVVYESPIYFHDSNGQNFSTYPGDLVNNVPGDHVAIVLLGKRKGKSFSWDGQFVLVFSQTPTENQAALKLQKSPQSKFYDIPSIIADWKLGSKILGKATTGWLSVISDAGASQTVWNGALPANITFPVFWTSDASPGNASADPFSRAVVWSCSAFQSSVRGSFQLPQHTSSGLVKWIRGEFYVQLKPNPDWSFYDVFTPGINYNSPVHFRDSAALDMDSLLVPYRSHPDPTSQMTGLKAPVILLGKRTKSMFSWNGSFIALISAPDEDEERMLWIEALDDAYIRLVQHDKEALGMPSVHHELPTFKHQTMMNSSFSVQQMTRLGFMNVGVAEFLHKLNKSYVAEKLTNTFNQEVHPLYCRFNPTVCPKTRYRSYDGSCNNRLHPDWGVALRPFERALSPDYCDDISKPRCSKSGTELPSARQITLKLHRGNYEGDSRFTMMLATWGQFIDHDMTSTVFGRSPMNRPVACCSGAPNVECFPVTITEDDPFFRDCNSTCMNFVRSAPAATCSIGKRQQMNQVSSFLDGSAVYGNTNELAKDLRELNGGRLAMLVTPSGQELLPPSISKQDGCNLEEEMLKGRYCFRAGDSRANENLYLTTLHVIMARQHNSLARKLLSINADWSDETVYQTARKIVVAQIQHITFNEFLEPIIGTAAMLNFNLTKYSYDETINPTINNHFAAASFRFAHTLLPSLMRLKSNDSEIVRLRELLFDPFPLYDEGGLDVALFGACQTHVGKSDRFFTEEVVYHLFQDKKTRGNLRCGLDLVSLNIQRGRDHGIPGYTKWRDYCNLPRLYSMDDLKGVMDDDSVTILRTLYESVDDIDLYSGALSEIPEDGSMLGPTFTCLISLQFHSIKQGDRFWYETQESPQAFTSDQLNEIKKTTLAGLICDNGDNVNRVPMHAMKSAALNQWVDCSMIPQLNLSAWNQK